MTTLSALTTPLDARPGPFKTLHATPATVDAGWFDFFNAGRTSCRVHLCTPGPTYRSRSRASFSVTPAPKSRALDASTSAAECLKKPFAPGPESLHAASSDASESSCDKVPSIAAAE